MLDKYFNYAISVDILFSLVLCSICYILISHNIIILPQKDILYSTVSDIANIGFTSAGFVLTFLTLLVSFKSSLKPYKKKSTLEETYAEVPIFDLFLNSPLYSETIRQLKNCVKVLIIISISGYVIKICLGSENLKILFFYNILGVSMISLILWRSLLVLSGVLKVQNKRQN